LKVTRKYSSSGFPDCRKRTIALLAELMLLLSFMLPLMSKMIPALIGADCWLNCTIDCSTLSSKTLKCSFSRPVTYRFKGSVTATCEFCNRGYAFDAAAAQALFADGQGAAGKLH